MWRTIPFGHPPLTETTRISEPHYINVNARPCPAKRKLGLARAGSFWTRIVTNSPRTNHKYLSPHRFSSPHRKKGAASGHALILRQHCTFYILHCTLYIEKRSKPVGLLSSAFRFWIMFFLIAEAADGISVDFAVAVPVHAHGVVVQVAGPHVGAALLSRRPEVGVVASAEELVVPAACRNCCNCSNMARFRSYWNRHQECSRHSRISWCEGSRASSTGRRFAP